MRYVSLEHLKLNRPLGMGRLCSGVGVNLTNDANYGFLSKKPLYSGFFKIGGGVSIFNDQNLLGDNVLKLASQTPIDTTLSTKTYFIDSPLIIIFKITLMNLFGFSPKGKRSNIPSKTPLYSSSWLL